jgi:hypothetical protein
MTEVFKPSGELCYSIQDTCFCGQACEALHKFWCNGAGEVVAHEGHATNELPSFSCAASPDGGAAQPCP